MHASKLKGLRVLVVEDEALIAMMVEDMLVEIGCVVAGSVADASGALAVVSSQPVDAVILDIHLADGESYGFADEMLQRGTPIVFCTGDSSSEIRRPYSSQPFITKPFGLEDLSGGLNRAFRERSPI